MELKDVWTAAAVLLGFQLAGFTWRLAREIDVAKEGGINWIPPADYMNLFSLLTTVLGVFVLPVTGLASPRAAERAFGLSVVLFAGYPFALLGHYGLLFNKGTVLPGKYSTRQEIIVIAITVLIAILYCFASVLRA